MYKKLPKQGSHWKRLLHSGSCKIPENIFHLWNYYIQKPIQKLLQFSLTCLEYIFLLESLAFIMFYLGLYSITLFHFVQPKSCTIRMLLCHTANMYSFLLCPISTVISLYYLHLLPYTFQCK